MYAKYQIDALKTSKTAVKYHNIYIAHRNNTPSITNATNKNICDKNIIAMDINIGKNRNIKKFSITLIFNINISKYSLNVVLKFNIASFDDFHIAENIFSFSSTI